MIAWVVAIGWIWLDLFDLQPPGRRRFLFAADGGGEKRKRPAIVRERPSHLPRLVNLDARRARKLWIDDVDDVDLASCPIESFARVERGEQRFAHVETLGQRLARAGIVKP